MNYRPQNDRRAAELPASSIQPAPRTGQNFDEGGLESLKSSIAMVGVLQPIVVREVSDGCYEILPGQGERRWRAAVALDRDTIPALVLSTPDDEVLRGMPSGR